MRRLAVRCRKANGQWGIGVLISTLDPEEVLALTQPTARPDADPATMRLSYVYLYDQRGSGVETSFKGDDIRFHDLRHSSATMLLSIGVHPKVVQEILGHSQIGRTMDIYSHVLPTIQQEAIGRLNDVLLG